MLKADELRTIYSSSLIETSHGHIRMTEKQEDKAALAEISLSASGDFIKICPEFLRKQQDVYRKCSGFINYKMICDGVLMYHKNENEHYLIIVEMKSGFSDVKKAVAQISSSYIKLKTHLTSFASYDATDYKEFGLIFSYPPRKEDYNDTRNNRMVMDAKRNFLPHTSVDQTENYLNKRKKELQVTGRTELDAKQMQIDLLPLKSDCLYNTLPILHQSVTTSSASLDLDDIVCRL
ncbi:MAG: hypothetical protein ACI3YB_03160 [Prevotella sp.]